MGAALKLTPAIRSRLGFYRVFGAARHQQIQKFQNLPKLEKQTHHLELGRAGSSLFNPCIINVLWGMQRLSRFVSMRRTPMGDTGNLVFRHYPAGLVHRPEWTNRLISIRHRPLVREDV